MGDAHPIPETLSPVKGWFSCFWWLQWFCLRRRIGQRRGATRASPGIHELMGLPRFAGRAFFRVVSLPALLLINLWSNCGKPVWSDSISRFV